MSFTVIATDPIRALPDEWTNEHIRRLFDHARELGQNGNPAGYLLTAAWAPWVSRAYEGERLLKRREQWDYDAIRTWIAANPDRVRVVWMYVVRTVY